MKKTILFLFIFLPVILIISRCTGNATEEDNMISNYRPTWVIPQDVASAGPGATQEDYYHLGWQSFIALNWPASLQYRGQPDTSKTIGDGRLGIDFPTVWESYKEQFDIFLENGANPGPWQWVITNGRAPMKILRNFSKNIQSEALEAFNEATGQPLIDMDSQYVRYEVRTNQAEYTYYLENKYFDADSQVAAVTQKRFVGFPRGRNYPQDSMFMKMLPVFAQFGATEVKAAWRVFGKNTPDSIKSRYYHTMATLFNTKGEKVEKDVGLIGLHILRLTPSTGSSWYWASFEQVDNLKLQSQYGGKGLPTHPTFNTNPPVTYGDSGYSYIPAAINYDSALPVAKPVGLSSPPFLQSNPVLDKVNKKYSLLLDKTPFKYYQLVGTINPPAKDETPYKNSSSTYPSVNVNTSWLANSTLETYMIQPSKYTLSNNNCITCHISGFPQGADSVSPKYPGSLQVFTFLPGFAKSSGGSKPKRIPFSLKK